MLHDHVLRSQLSFWTLLHEYLSKSQWSFNVLYTIMYDCINNHVDLNEKNQPLTLTVRSFVSKDKFEQISKAIEKPNSFLKRMIWEEFFNEEYRMRINVWEWFYLSHCWYKIIQCLLINVDW